MGAGLIASARRRTVLDADFSSTVLLLGMNGTLGSTTFTDESAAARGTATVVGDAHVSTALKKFGTGSLRTDGAGNDAIKFLDHADFTLAALDFTMEGWFSWDPSWIDNTSALVSHYSTTSNQRGWIFQYDGSGATNILTFVASSTGSSASVIVSGNWTPTGNTFYHLVAERSGNTFRLYVDGTMLAKATNSLTIFDSASSCIISGTANGLNLFQGNTDELRFTLGVARYDSDSGYTVPTSAFPRS
jgi:hypothetical protein